jgi:hypothetical protein
MSATCAPQKGHMVEYSKRKSSTVQACLSKNRISSVRPPPLSGSRLSTDDPRIASRRTADEDFRRILPLKTDARLSFHPG